jgi:hypothetical protein
MYDTCIKGIETHFPSDRASNLVTLLAMLSRISLLPRFNNSSMSLIHTCFQYCLTKHNHMILIIIAWIISDLRREVDENCTLLGYYAASSGNSLPTFRYKLSVPFSMVKNPKPLKTGPINFPETSVRNIQYWLRNITAKQLTPHSMNKAWFLNVTYRISVLHILFYCHNFFSYYIKILASRFSHILLLYSRQSQVYLSNVSDSSSLPSQSYDRNMAFSKTSSPHTAI